MEFAFSESQRMMRESIGDLMAEFDRTYWQECDVEGRFPWEFWEAAADAGWVGMSLPTEYGGGDANILDTAIVMEAMAENDGGMIPVLPIVRTVMVGEVIGNYGTHEQKERYLPPLANGETVPAFAITEPNTGFDSLGMETTGRRDGDEWVIEGEKVFASGATIADHVLVVARTRAIEEVEKKSRGISLFMVPTDADGVEIEPIDKVVIRSETTTTLHLDSVRLPDDHLVGEENAGWYHVLDSLNPERITLGAGCVGCASLALDLAADHAKNRVVFDRPIGKNQGIQFPLAEAWVATESARLLIYQAASRYDAGADDAGIMTNAAKIASSNAAYQAADAGMQTFGGWSVTEEYDMNRLWRDARFFQIAPVSNELTKTFIAERALGLPKSY